MKRPFIPFDLVSPNMLTAHMILEDFYFKQVNFDQDEFIKQKLSTLLIKGLQDKVKPIRNKEKEKIDLQLYGTKVQAHEASLYVFTEDELKHFAEVLFEVNGVNLP